MSCPFFGLALIGRIDRPVLLESNGNQCALITAAHSPCRMQLAGDQPNWKECPRNPANNGTGPNRERALAEMKEAARSRRTAREAEPRGGTLVIGNPEEETLGE